MSKLSCSDYSFYNYLNKVNSIPSLSKEDEIRIARTYYISKDLSSAHILVTSHLKLVVKIAMGFKQCKLPLTDLISEGNIGLMHAVKKYNPDLGYRLSTYAMWWIKAYIQDFILKSWSLVKIGSNTLKKKIFCSLKKFQQKISISSTQESGTGTTNTALQLSSDIGEISSNILTSKDLSLNQPINREDDEEMISLIPETRNNQEAILIDTQDDCTKKKLVKESLQSLSQREREILIARRLKEKPLTLEELSNKFLISKERVRQIENKAFTKLRSTILASNLVFTL